MRPPFLLAIALALCSCGGRAPSFDAALLPLPAVTAAGALVVVVPQTDRAVIIRPDRKPLALRLPPGARVAAASPSGDLVAVLGGTARAPSLALVEVAALQVDTLPLHGAFDAIHISPDGRRALLTYGKTPRADGLAARNPNECDLVDLITRTVVRLQLDVDSMAPSGVLFAPPGADGTSRLAAVTFERGLAVLDLLHPERASRRIAIRPQGLLSDSVIAQAVFGPGGRHLFVRASGLDDVIAIALETETGELQASLNFLSGGSGLLSLAPLQSGGAPPGVVALYQGTQEAVFLDAQGQEDLTRRVALPEPLTQLHVQADGRVIVSDPRLRSVVAWDPASGRSGTLALDAAHSEVHHADGAGKVVFHHPSLRGSAALSVVTVEEEPSRLRLRLGAIQLANPVQMVAARPELLFLAGASSETLVRLDLGGLALAQLDLDAPVASVHRVSDGWMAVLHSASWGAVTFVPADGPTRETAIHYTGYLLTDEAGGEEE